MVIATKLGVDQGEVEPESGYLNRDWMYIYAVELVLDGIFNSLLIVVFLS
ncbi:MAG: hypothetical protein OXC80_05460 [Gammaproteobacteria bacterium]|nr:hypothetical protein [Gammaproteobacteria bacterium]